MLDGFRKAEISHKLADRYVYTDSIIDRIIIGQGTCIAHDKCDLGY